FSLGQLFLWLAGNFSWSVGIRASFSLAKKSKSISKGFLVRPILFVFQFFPAEFNGTHCTIKYSRGHFHCFTLQFWGFLIASSVICFIPFVMVVILHYFLFIH